jgi:hypothetical protein
MHCQRDAVTAFQRADHKVAVVLGLASVSILGRTMFNNGVPSQEIPTVNYQGSLVPRPTHAADYRQLTIDNSN